MINPRRVPILFLTVTIVLWMVGAQVRCAAVPSRPAKLKDERTLAFVRASCPAGHRLIFQQYGGLSREYALDCGEFAGQLVAFRVRPGLHELYLSANTRRNDLRWTANLFDVQSEGKAYYWGDINTDPGGTALQIRDNPASRREFSDQVGTIEIVFGVTDEN